MADEIQGDLAGPGTAAAGGEGRTMGFFDHLEELRWTLVKCAGVFLLFAILIGVYLKELNDVVVLWPMQQAMENLGRPVPELATKGAMEIFSVILQMCLAGGLGLASPFMLFFLGQFVGPALTSRERRVVVPLCLAALMLFLMGGAFGYFLLAPTTIEVSTRTNEWLGSSILWFRSDYFSMLAWMVFGVGGAFEFPLVIILLVWMGVLSATILQKYRRHSVIVILIIAALVTPTADPITMLLLAAPLYVLFEVAVVASIWIERKKHAGGART